MEFAGEPGHPFNISCGWAGMDGIIAPTFVDTAKNVVIPKRKETYFYYKAIDLGSGAFLLRR